MCVLVGLWWVRVEQVQPALRHGHDGHVAAAELLLNPALARVLVLFVVVVDVRVVPVRRRHRVVVVYQCSRVRCAVRRLVVLVRTAPVRERHRDGPIRRKRPRARGRCTARNGREAGGLRAQAAKEDGED